MYTNSQEEAIMQTHNRSNTLHCFEQNDKQKIQAMCVVNGTTIRLSPTSEQSAQTAGLIIILTTHQLQITQQSTNTTKRTQHDTNMTPVQQHRATTTTYDTTTQIQQDT